MSIGSETRRTVTEEAAQRESAVARWGRRASALVVLGGVVVLLFPSIAHSQSEQVQAQSLTRYVNMMAAAPQESLNVEMERAVAYNVAIGNGSVVDPFSREGQRAGKDGDTGEYGLYRGILDVGPVMARVRIPSIDLDMPVHHGTGEWSLSQGAGHVFGTPVPIGGAGTRSVITAHTGLPSAKMFDDLVDVKAGDEFFIEVLGQTLTYRVFAVEVVRPDQVEYLRAMPGRDLVTLLTCTPYGIKTHRLLVTGERMVSKTSPPVTEYLPAPVSPSFPWWIVALIGTVAVLVLATVLAERPRRREPMDKGIAVVGLGSAHVGGSGAVDPYCGEEGTQSGRTAGLLRSEVSAPSGRHSSRPRPNSKVNLGKPWENPPPRAM